MMALAKFRQPDPEPLDPFEMPQVTPLADDEDYAAAVALLAALRARDERRQQELDRLALEGAFESKPNGAADGPRDKTLRERLSKLQALEDYWHQESTDPAPLNIPAPALARGLELLRGGDALPEMSRQERLDRLHREGLVLDDAIRFQAGVVDEVRDAKSYRMCLSLKAHHDAVLLTFYRAAQALAAITDREREFRSAVIMAGYEVRPDLIGPPFISAPLMLGSERQYDSQISTYRRHLQDQGVIS
jgi:hypothetical protein